MSIQKELKKWADKAAKGYVSIANEFGEDAPSFYTQSDLTKLLNFPDIMVLGINPGSEGLYYQQKTQFGWGLNGSDMDGCHLRPFWIRLKDYFRDVKTGNPLDDESKFVVTNMSFFNSKKARNITNPLFYKSLPFSIDLIKILQPKQIVFLGGKGILDKLTRFNRNNRLFDMNYEIIKPRVCKGLFNGIPFLAVPHPSAYLKREERQVVIDCITNFMN